MSYKLSEGDRKGKKDLLSSGSLPRWLKHPGLAQEEARSSCRSPSWVQELMGLGHLPCFPVAQVWGAGFHLQPVSMWDMGATGSSFNGSTTVLATKDLIFLAPDTAAGFLDENLAKLPPPKEDYERKLNSSQELRQCASSMCPSWTAASRRNHSL